LIITLASLCEPLWAQGVVLHKLTVASNSALLLTNMEIDTLLASVNRLLAARSYPWDVSCSNVQLVRNGDVIQSDQLLLTGSFSELAASLAGAAPSANVLVVSAISCGLVTNAAGCGSAAGGEPLIVGQYPGYDDQLWAHERGHNVKLPHSAEAPTKDTAVDPSIGMRFMFWQLGLNHLGKTADECRHFMTSQLPSIVKRSASPGADLSVPPDANDIALAKQVAKTATAPPRIDYDESIRSAARDAGLTVAAYRIVGAPWVEAMPLAAMRALSMEDIQSIRSLFAKEPNVYWPEAITTLGIVGNNSDIDLIEKVLELPVAASPPGETLDQKGKDALRLLFRIKLAAPTALGILGNRTQSDSAVTELTRAATIEGARELIGNTAAVSLSKRALLALAISASSAADNFLKSGLKSGDNTNKPPGLDSSRDNGVPQLTPSEIAAIKKAQREVRRIGIEKYLENDR